MRLSELGDRARTLCSVYIFTSKYRVSQKKGIKFWKNSLVWFGLVEVVGGTLMRKDFILLQLSTHFNYFFNLFLFFKKYNINIITQQ